MLSVSEFEWDDGNALHLQLGHGIEPEEVEEVFAVAPLLRRTKRGHYAVFGPTRSGRHLVVVFERKPGNVARPITGWDMMDAERRYYERNRRGR
ncbi:MAG: BrnT family toxin [Planctomycetes bacterium]|nr:BrnT family toxin [Planctomycetota bacterium]